MIIEISKILHVSDLISMNANQTEHPSIERITYKTSKRKCAA